MATLDTAILNGNLPTSDPPLFLLGLFYALQPEFKLDTRDYLALLRALHFRVSIRYPGEPVLNPLEDLIEICQFLWAKSPRDSDRIEALIRGVYALQAVQEYHRFACQCSGIDSMPIDTESDLETLVRLWIAHSSAQPSAPAAPAYRASPHNIEAEQALLGAVVAPEVEAIARIEHERRWSVRVVAVAAQPAGREGIAPGRQGWQHSAGREVAGLPVGEVDANVAEVAFAAQQLGGARDDDAVGPWAQPQQGLGEQRGGARRISGGDHARPSAGPLAEPAAQRSIASTSGSGGRSKNIPLVVPALAPRRNA